VTNGGAVIAATKAGAAYFAIVFAAGFALGTMRVLLLAPRIGAMRAVALELPVMLTVSWFACGWSVTRFAVPGAATCQLAMGGVAFILLMAAETVLSFASGRDPAAYLASFATAEGALGLAGQVMFALFPLIRLRTRTR
jgi:hypothetical protein